MKLLFHFPGDGVSNTYVIGPDEGGDAILIDPGRFDVPLLEMIEHSGYYIRTVLLTHDHRNHIMGLGTLLKIYDAEILAGDESVTGFNATCVRGGDNLQRAGFDIHVIDASGHSPDSRVYKVGPHLFTGDAMSAGRIGTTNSPVSLASLVAAIKTRLLKFSDDTLLLPGHGPPTTVGVEKRWNPELQ